VASIIKLRDADGKPDGRITLQFRNPNGKRSTLYLGHADDLTTLEVKKHLEHIIRSVKNGTLPSVITERWLAELLADPARTWIYDRLAALELVTERPEQAESRAAKQAKDATQRPPLATLGPFLADYIKRRSDVKPGTLLAYRQTQNSLVKRFGADKPLAEITAGDAMDFKRWLLAHGKALPAGRRGPLAKATANRRTKAAKQFFEDAVEHELIARNPFRKVKGGASVNKERLRFVSRTVTGTVLDACPDAEWRAIVALSRYGGIRIPSELLPLMWADVNLEQDKLTITSPKTEHCDKGYRVIPVEVFGDVRPYLEDLLKLAMSRGPVRPTDYIITRYREVNSNLRTQLLRILKRAGVEPWPRLFQNLRSSRETELIYHGYKIHEVCAWIGNSPAVANDHYLQVLDSVERAELEERLAQSQSATSFCNAAGKNTLTAGGCKKQAKPGKTPEKRGFSPISEETGVGPEGFEPPTKGL
jgi:integrase